MGNNEIKFLSGFLASKALKTYICIIVLYSNF